MNEFFATIKTYSLLILPWIFLGIVLAYLYNRFFNHRHTIHHLKKTPTLFQIISTQILGMVSPLSIMSFFPIATELVLDGVNAGLLLSFLIAERVYDLQSFFIINALFGSKFALLSAASIFFSLVVTAWFLKHQPIKFHADKQKSENFWVRQVKLLVLVTVGIVLGAAIKVFVPHNFTTLNLFSSLLLGLVSYVGPVVGNYPIAKSLLDIGMTPTGAFALITISPLLNIVIATMFSSVVGSKITLKAIGIYTLTNLLLLIPINFFILK